MKATQASRNLLLFNFPRFWEMKVHMKTWMEIIRLQVRWETMQSS